jgi:TetR/AcrR family transcriptional repressor of nem operon
MTVAPEAKERPHTSILASAVRLLRSKGISGASVANVMKGAGLTVGGFYAHFDSKEALVDAVLRRSGAEHRERLFARLDEKPEADRAEVVLKRYLSTAHRDADTYGCPLPAVVGEVGTTAAEHRDVLSEQIEALSARFGEQLPETHGLSRRAVALGLVALMYGGLSLARALRGTPLSDEVIRACRSLGIATARGTPR